jgi:hypothetical protein
LIHTGLEYVLSSWDEGRPKKRLLFLTIVEYFVVGGILIVFSFVLLDKYSPEGMSSFWQLDWTVFQYVSVLFLFLGVVAILFGIRNLIPETITVSNQGITISKGKKQWTGVWSEVLEIRNNLVFYPSDSMGGKLGGAEPVHQVIIVTNSWKYKLKSGKFSVGDLKVIYLELVEHVKNTHIELVDVLEWLPEHLRSLSTISARTVRMREYKLLIKIGSILMLIGGILGLAGFLIGNTMGELAGGIGFAILFIGFICILAGWLGKGEEREKK